MANANRPRLDIPVSNSERTAESLAAVGIAFQAYIFARYWFNLPDAVPTHFGVSGEADAFGSKYVSLMLPIISVVIYVGLTLLQRIPHHYNYLIRITESTARRQYSLARSLITWLKAELLWLFGYIFWKTCVVALEGSGGLGALFLPATLFVIFGTLGYYLVLSLRND